MPLRVRLSALLIGLTVALVGAQSAQTQAVDPTIYVHYTMNCTFSVVGDNGAPISMIPPGNYQIMVTSPIPFGEIDLSGVADPNLACGHSLSFRLSGPGVNLHTTLEEGDASSHQLQAAFQVGTYVAQEDRRAAVTRTVITVASSAPSTGGGSSGGSSGGGSSGGSTTKPTSSASANSAGGTAFRGWLNGNVDTVGKLTLRFKGKPVKSVKSGRYSVAVVDEAPKSSFTLQRVGRTAVVLTRLSFVGRKTRTITLSPGRWVFYSASAKKKSFFTVTA